MTTLHGKSGRSRRKKLVCSVSYGIISFAASSARKTQIPTHRGKKNDLLKQIEHLFSVLFARNVSSFLFFGEQRAELKFITDAKRNIESQSEKANSVFVCSTLYCLPSPRSLRGSFPPVAAPSQQIGKFDFGEFGPGIVCGVMEPPRVTQFDMVFRTSYLIKPIKT